MTHPQTTSDQIESHELMKMLGRAFYFVANTNEDRTLHGWTTVEAFARIAGLCARTNSIPGQEEHVLDGAMLEMQHGFDNLVPDDFLPRPEEVPGMWRPIATAPKGRGSIIVGLRKGGDHELFIDFGNLDYVAFGFWTTFDPEGDGKWVIIGGQWEPTHWLDVIIPRVPAVKP